MPAESDMVHNHDYDPGCREHIRPSGRPVGDCMAPFTIDGLRMHWCDNCQDWARRDAACPNGPSEPHRNDLESPSSTSVDHSPTGDAKGPQIPDTDWANERTDVLVRFMVELQRATGDGSRKRQAGTKPPWYQDDSHEGAILSHLTKWKRGELVDPDSGAHPLVHAAWRCLAIACRETGNTP